MISNNTLRVDDVLANESSNGNSNENFDVSSGARIQPQVGGKREFRFGYAIGIFLTSAAVLVLEVALTRIFSYVLWSHLAFMVVSTALFGFGLSGVFLSLRSGKGKSTEDNFFLPVLGFAFSILVAYAVINYVPFKLFQVTAEKKFFLNLCIWYTSLILPFFFAGIVIARILSGAKEHAATLYGIDLIGAAMGALLFIPIVTWIGGEGAIFFAAGLAAIAGIAICNTSKQKITVGLLGIVLCITSLEASQYLPIQLNHDRKRKYNDALESGQILRSMWSTLSRVDLAGHIPVVKKIPYKMRAIWIDGGTNESVTLNLPEDWESLPPQVWSAIAAPYQLKLGSNPRTLIIGSSGGRETFIALSHGARHVDALEMDPSIVKIVNEPEQASYMGYLFQNPRVSLINDEGRSFMRRQPEGSYDVIQFVNNYTPVAIASGALNLSETFLLTKEAVADFWGKLSDNGVLAIHRGNSLRAAITIVEGLRELGVQDPESYLVVTNGEWNYFEGLYLKKSPWTKDEVVQLDKFLKTRPRVNNKTFLWTPFDRERGNLYTKILRAPVEEQRKMYYQYGVNLFPATDNQPFLEHMLQFGSEELSAELPDEFRWRNKRKAWGVIPEGDFPYVAILLQSAMLALVFVALPLLIWGRAKDVQKRDFWGLMGFFSSLGFAFIVVEICLMKKYVLFLGSPAYSITTIIVALLAGAGLGSIFTGTIPAAKCRKALVWAVSAIAAGLLFETFLAERVFQYAMHLEFTGRVLVSMMLLMPVGFLMGMPFSLGLKTIDSLNVTEEDRRKLVAWAWGMNGYTTVIGSALSVFIALYAGFKLVLVVAIGVYLLGLLSILQVRKSRV